MITDTQIVSYYFRGAAPIPDEPIRISSITAAEFLEIQGKRHDRANYYPMLPARYGHGMRSASQQGPVAFRFDSRRHAASGKHRTDQLILNFAGDAPTYVEFGSIAISQLINSRHGPLYDLSISHLDKDVQKKLRDRFRFLVDCGIECVALTPTVGTVGMDLLAKFLKSYQAKTNFRNTVNDVLILATAITSGVALKTEDDLLRRFAAETLNAPLRHDGAHLVIDFSAPDVPQRRKSLESKGYINRGWQVHERRQR